MRTWRSRRRRPVGRAACSVFALVAFLALIPHALATSEAFRTTLPAAKGYDERRTYDRAGRLTEVENAKGAAILSRFVYTLDPVGNPTQTTGTDGRVTYTYDPLDRLTEVCYAALCPGLLDPAIRWTYDAVGNRLTETRPEGTTTYSGVHQPRQPWQNEAHPPWRQEWWRAHVARAPWQTPFPQGWSGDRIMHELSDIATDPASRVVAQQGGRTVLEGTRGGTVIRVVTDGRDIITGFPVR